MNMKRLITISLSLVIGLFMCELQAQKIPMAVFGDMYIAEDGAMTSTGPVHLKVISESQKAQVANYGNLEMDAVHFYTNNDVDGLLLHGDKSGSDISTSTVSVRRAVRRFAWIMLSFPFDVDLTSGVKTAKEGIPLVRDTHFLAYYYNAAKRADLGLKETGNEGVEIWENLPNGTTTLKKGIGYRIAVSLDAVHGLGADTVGAAAGNFHIDFFAKQEDITPLFSGVEKGVHLVFDSIPPGKWYQDGHHSEGWNAIGGLHSTNFETRHPSLAGKTTEFKGSSIFVWDDRPGGWKPFNPEFEEGTLRPYAVFFVQTTREMHDNGQLHYVPGKPMADKGGFVFLREDPNYDPRTLPFLPGKPVFRSATQNSSPDKLIVALTNERDNSTFSTFFKFNEEGSSFYDTYGGEDKGLSIALSENIHYVWTSAMVESTAEYTRAYTKLLPIGESEVKLGVATHLQGGDYVFSMRSLKNETITSVVLWDKETKIATNLLTDSYRFGAGSARLLTEDRFVLYINHHNAPTSLDPSADAPDIYAYVENNKLIVKNVQQGDRVQVLDLTGRTIISGIASGDEFSATLNQKGIYIVNVNGMKTLKVLGN
jgi:hypothetical protein